MGDLADFVTDTVDAVVEFTEDTVNFISGQTAEDIAASQAESSEQTSAAQEAQATASRRRQVREARVRKGQVEQASAGSGTGGSSSSLSAVGNIATQLSVNLAAQEGQTEAARSISKQNQKTAELQLEQEVTALQLDLLISAGSAAAGGA